MSGFLLLSGGAAPVSGGVDPSAFTLRQLAAIRGDMWPQAGFPGLPLGPRPGDPSNIIDTGYIHNYPPELQAMVVARLKGAGYTHVQVGPWNPDGDQGYHGQFGPQLATWDDFLSLIEWWWARGFIPIVFLKPDNWTFERFDAVYTPLISTPRAQAVIRVVVPAGWEPSGAADGTVYGWSSVTWALFLKWGRDRLPNAVNLAHTPVKSDGAPPDALCGVDQRHDDNTDPDAATWWRRVVPYLHGWLIQSGPFRFGPADNPRLAEEWGAMFGGPKGAQYHGIGWHFETGIWPRDSAWGAGNPIRLYAAEQTAYEKYNHGDMPESAVVAWGDLAVANGASGYLNGGTVPVPVR